jgi:hypothetical protein
VTVVVSDGSQKSETITGVIDTIPAPAPPPPSTAPVVTWSGSSNEFFFGGPASQIGAVMVQSTGNSVTGATVTISPGTLQPGDTLNFTPGYGITGSYSNGVLTLTGTAAPESYEITINSVTFSTTSTSTVSRELLIVASDGSLASAPSTEWELTQPPYTPPAGGGTLVTVSPIVPIGWDPVVGSQSAAKSGVSFLPLALGSLETPAVTTRAVTSWSNFNFAPVDTVSTTTTTGTGSNGSETKTTSSTAGQHGSHPFAASDKAIADFDLTDLYVY